MANDNSEAPTREPEQKAKRLRVQVVEDGHPAVNVKVPIGVAKWGMKMAQAFAPEMEDQPGLGNHHRHHPGRRAGKDRGGGRRRRPQDR